MMGGAILILLGVVVLVVFLAGGFGDRLFKEGQTGKGSDTREILAERFARGEISEEEFEQRRRVLERPS